jgi:hypothetical protein
MKPMKGAPGKLRIAASQAYARPHSRSTREVNAMKPYPFLLLLACSIAQAAEPGGAAAPEASKPPSQPVDKAVERIVKDLRGLQYDKGFSSTVPLIVIRQTCYFMRTIRPVDPPSYSSGFILLQYHPAEMTQSTCTTGARTLRAQRPAPSAADGHSHAAANLRKPRRS